MRVSQFRKRVLKMDTIISFVAEYSGPILAVISAIFIFRFAPEDGPIWKIIKACAALMSIGVIVMCFVDFISPKGPGKFPTTEPGKVETVPIVTVSEPTENRAVEPDLLKEVAESSYATIEASSTYDGDRAIHIPYNLVDNNLKTNWTEGVQGNGEGQYIQFAFKTEQPVAGFVIAAGNHASDMYYAKNSRPKTITLTFSDGSAEKFTLMDKKEEQTFCFEKVIHTTDICLTIDSVYTGSAYEDTVISEISFLKQE